MIASVARSCDESESLNPFKLVEADHYCRHQLEFQRIDRVPLENLKLSPVARRTSR
jgi:hypothetical protein